MALPNKLAFFVVLVVLMVAVYVEDVQGKKGRKRAANTDVQSISKPQNTIKEQKNKKVHHIKGHNAKKNERENKKNQEKGRDNHPGIKKEQTQKPIHDIDVKNEEQKKNRGKSVEEKGLKKKMKEKPGENHVKRQITDAKIHDTNGAQPISKPQNTIKEQKDQKAHHIKGQDTKKNENKKKKEKRRAKHPEAGENPTVTTTNKTKAGNEKKKGNIKEERVTAKIPGMKKQTAQKPIPSVDVNEKKNKTNSTEGKDLWEKMKDIPVYFNRWITDIKTPSTSDGDIQDQIPLLQDKEMLHKNLQSFLETIAPPQETVSKHRNIVDHFLQEMERRLQGEQKSLKFGNLGLVGSVSEGVQVIAADDFDVSVAIDIGHLSAMASQTPGYDFIESPNCTRTKLCGHDNLKVVPFKVISRLQSIIQENLNYFQKFSPNLKYNLGFKGPTVKVEILEGEEFLVRIEFVPLVTSSNGNRYVAKSYKDEDIETVTVWRRSFAREERELLSKFNRKSTCHLDVLRIMKAIVKRDPELNTTKKHHRLTSYHMKTTLFTLISETQGIDWSPNQLPSYFVKFLQRLKDFLNQGCMKSHFLDDGNLFNSISKSDMPRIINRIDTFLKEPKHLYRILSAEMKDPAREEL
ncbi:uncharacterized protein LOC106168778 [Lingula anatina]|uniref:Uncharacterized protein LOC106168778 n=1 Tax=Lingula anatina TaxID=7574 RepID=A0A1S3IYY3_LINAN|nr:uncharacterized protein LOC106168778 [Lingula anatina]XP_013403412.1 uncharacterized protein LOC106168778 [Lingula anatina]XP_013403413.1 uncharacterized protein LOC106168778 [Lingula anatina]XP_013403414.1 uncharacterized protein LOC106168778 [Lingula anatina]XP_013403415.1 uncharacterized protein LOC106168778 [Lingula anatina]|eukprot:XP_013403411.1 uncharacterized protein LOC106168778 [Lingula anatina]